MAEFNPCELYRTFEESDYGQDLAQRTRFNVFKPEWVSTELWGRLLGDDVNNLYHMSHTYELAQRFALYENIGEVATRALLTTAITHDWGEAIIGDIPLPDKTDDDEKREYVAYKHIAQELLGGTVGEKLANTVIPVLRHAEVKVGDMFKAVEYIGYCTTAMRAGQVATRLVHGFQSVPAERPQKDQLIGSLLGMERAVSVHNFPVLTAYVQKYPSIEDQLKEIR
jgi:hypothetical protein